MSRPFRKPRPVLPFGAFFQSDLQFCDKVGGAVAIERFPYVSAYACSASNQLVCQHGLFLFPFDLIANLDDLQGKFL